MKRFYKETGTDAAEDGYRVVLDGRPVRTPAKSVLVVPTRALGEAIAVSQVSGGGTVSHLNLFKNGGTMASIIALQFPSPVNALHKASLLYLGVLLLVIGVIANLLASEIGARFGSAGGMAVHEYRHREGQSVRLGL